MKRIIFQPLALEQFKQWEWQDEKIFSKITKFIDNILKNPFTGIGKPEPLKHILQGCWSRRITKVHRLVYQVTADAIIIVSCKYHY